jgi:23S rRNA pseudouridine1911/1915/1917 synthase
LLIKENQFYNLISYVNDEDCVTLKELLLDKLNLSVRFLSKAKKDKNLFVNKEHGHPSQILKKGDLIEIKIDEDMGNFTPQNLNIDILYEDFDIIMVNKPPYIVVHPTKSHSDNTVANGLTYYLLNKCEYPRIRFVNRLDMNTSGLLIVAKNAYGHHILSQDMGEDKVTKKYLTVVDGIVKEDKGTINEPIYRPTEDSIKRVVDEKGQPSITHYKVIERLKNATILEVLLETGRTHQIRVHMNHIGHGIIGDELYGIDTNLINRQALHAYKLEFEQPRTKEKLCFEADIPDDMKQLIDNLR